MCDFRKYLSVLFSCMRMECGGLCVMIDFQVEIADEIMGTVFRGDLTRLVFWRQFQIQLQHEFTP